MRASGRDERPTTVRTPSPPAKSIRGGRNSRSPSPNLQLLLLASTRDSLARSNAVKNVILGLANATAALAFIVFSSVHWSFVVPLALGCFAGGRIGPVVVRYAPDRPLRIAIAMAGMGLAIHLGIDAYR
jgi:uncharacterized membrane protein YfcA